MNERMISRFQHFFRCRMSDKEVIVVFHDNSTITRVKYALCLTHFRLFFTVNMLELGPIGFHSIFISCCFEHISVFFLYFFRSAWISGSKTLYTLSCVCQVLSICKTQKFFF